MISKEKRGPVAVSMTREIILRAINKTKVETQAAKVGETV